MGELFLSNDIIMIEIEDAEECDRESFTKRLSPSDLPDTIVVRKRRMKNRFVDLDEYEEMNVKHDKRRSSRLINIIIMLFRQKINLNNLIIKIVFEIV